MPWLVLILISVANHLRLNLRDAGIRQSYSAARRKDWVTCYFLNVGTLMAYRRRSFDQKNFRDGIADGLIGDSCNCSPTPSQRWRCPRSRWDLSLQPPTSCWKNSCQESKATFSKGCNHELPTSCWKKSCQESKASFWKGCDHKIHKTRSESLSTRAKRDSSQQSRYQQLCWGKCYRWTFRCWYRCSFVQGWGPLDWSTSWWCSRCTSGLPSRWGINRFQEAVIILGPVISAVTISGTSLLFA